MSTAELVDENQAGREVTTQLENLPVPYSVSDSKIAEIRERCTGLTATTKEGYEEVRLAIAGTRKLRVSIEEQRENLKRPALEFGRKVDAEAKRLIGLLKAIEEPLQAEKDRADAEKERIKREAAEAERIKLEARLNQLQAVGALIAPITVQHWTEEEFTANLVGFTKSHEAILQAQREEAERKAKEEAEQREAIRLEQERLAAERAELDRQRKAAEESARIERERIEAEQAAERARLEAERAKIEAEQKAERDRLDAERRKIEEQQRVEREKIEADQRAIAAERQRMADAEAARIAAIKAEEEAKARAEQERTEAERKAAEEAEQARLAVERAESLKPDKAKIANLAESIRAIDYPKVRTMEAVVFLQQLEADLISIADRCESFGS